jgi:hypothetical protein
MQDAADATMEVAKTLNEKISKYCLVTIETCAYAGTGNVLKVALLFSFSIINSKHCVWLMTDAVVATRIYLLDKAVRFAMSTRFFVTIVV